MSLNPSSTRDLIDSFYIILTEFKYKVNAIENEILRYQIQIQGLLEEEATFAGTPLEVRNSLLRTYFDRLKELQECLTTFQFR